MKTPVTPKTPEEIGISLVICSGPRGAVLNEWPCIEYTVQLTDSRRRPIWTGDYRLGVGHVKPMTYDKMSPIWTNNYSRRELGGMSEEERNCSHYWARGTQFNYKDIRTANLVASTAAKLASIQRVKPKLNDVCHSLVMDGAAFFDGERFEDWCANYGYSDDSIKAKETFETCDRIGRDLSRALSRDELESLREWASNY